MIAAIDNILKARGRHAVGGGTVPWVELSLVLAGCGFIYGAVMGSYDMRILQAAYSGLKVPLFLGISTLICLPSFYAVNTFLGLRADFAAAFRGILASQASLAVCLTALAPVTAFTYVSVDNYRFAIIFNGIMFAVGTLAGQQSLSRHYKPLIQANPRHRAGKMIWVLVYVFVAIQMAWVLRPFIGAPGLPTRFFREEAWSNAYVEIARILAELFKLR
jgi:hypothetical protein